MEPWVPQRPPQPRGRPPGSSKDPERGRWRDGYYWPVPYSWYNRERAHQRQDLGRSPQPQQDPRADQQQPHYASRPGEWHQPGSEADYYEGGYPSQFYLRYGVRAWSWPTAPECVRTDSFPVSFDVSSFVLLLLFIYLSSFFLLLLKL